MPTYNYSINTVTVDIEYTEPTGQVDLLETRIYYDKGAGDVLVRTVGATGGTGGGSVVTAIDIPIINDEIFNAELFVTAVDTSFNESIITDLIVMNLTRLSLDKWGPDLVMPDFVPSEIHAHSYLSLFPGLVPGEPPGPSGPFVMF